jgi:hypothetical protein
MRDVPHPLTGRAIRRVIPLQIPLSILENAMIRTACNLNRLPLLMLVSALLTATLVASPRLHATDAGPSTDMRSLIIDCDRRHVTQRKASWLLGTDNFSQTYDRRAALYAEVARACATGIATVRIEGRKATVAVTRLSGR